ncbi:U-box domain-containing protein 33 [Carex littledalei]|uniref:U-box domain-containing protein 33 n=1 Tax=Carex littledalei TaxID=544730 RepID=A0A833R941_9POAL|nr:U-box domain-containing protein 33 [Carex littledalei]
MEWQNEATYHHKSGAGAGASASASVGADINLEIKEARDDDITARPSEIEENRMAVAVSNTGNDMPMERAQDIEDEKEIIEVEDSGRLQPHVELPSGGDGEDVYVAVGKSASSMDALSWALKNVVKPGSFVYLIHVFPEVHQIPMPLGSYMPKDSLSKDQVDKYMNEQRATRHQMLQKYLNLCRKSKVEFDVHLIESDQVGNAIVELISVLNIKILVVGTSKRNLRRLKKGGTKAGIIQKNSPHYCEVKIICEGKDISTITSTVPDQTPPGSPLDSENTKTTRRQHTPKSSPSPEIPSINRSGSTNSPTKENKLKKLFRYFSCTSGANVH